jgi:hypothetical protein
VIFEEKKNAIHHQKKNDYIKLHWLDSKCQELKEPFCVPLLKPQFENVTQMLA